MPVEVAQQSGIEAWINQYGNIVYFFGQLFFWIALAIAAIYAVILFKKLVDHATGTAKAPEATDSSADSKKPDVEKPVKIEDFVE